MTLAVGTDVNATKFSDEGTIVEQGSHESSIRQLLAAKFGVRFINNLKRSLKHAINAGMRTQRVTG